MDPSTPTTTTARALLKKKCADCHEEKGLSLYTKKQSKKESGKGLCRLCWDAKLRKENAPKSEKKCNRCDITIVRSLDGKRKRCDSLSCKEETARKRKERKQEIRRKQEEIRKSKEEIHRKRYYLSPGVSYDFFSDKLEYRQGQLNNQDLVGKYDLIFYATSRSCCGEGLYEEVHRTAAGEMVLETSQWAGKPALVGSFFVTGRSPVTIGYNFQSDEPGGGKLFHEQDWRHGSIAEAVTDEELVSEYCRNLKDYSSWEAQKLFVLDRHSNRRRTDWYEGIESGEDYDRSDYYCGAKISVVAKKAALGLSFDRFHGLYSPPEYTGSKPRDLDHAEKLFDNHKQGLCHSWMSNHLGLSASIATIIGQFVSPPPVFFVQPGDLVLHVEESSEPEWNKYFVFRNCHKLEP